MKNKQPAIRFKGFTEDWEQNKLKNLCIYHTSNLSINDTTKNGDYELYDANGVIGYTNQNIQNEDYITIIKDGSGVGRVRMLTKNTSFISTMGALQCKNSDINYLFNLLCYFDFSKHITGATIPHIYFSNYGEEYVTAPKLNEQIIIGEFFKQIDNLINIYQRKYDKLVNIKKSLLEKMFPKSDSNVPAIRFKGFTEDWEKHKLKDILSLIKDGTHGTHEDVEDGIYLLSAKNIKEGKIIIDKTDRKISRNDYEKIHKNFKIQKGDVLMTIVGTIGETAIVENSENITFQRSVAYLRSSSKLNNFFLIATINTKDFQSKLISHQSASAQSGIYLGELASIIIFTSVLQEQKKIGKFFKQIDNLINLYQRKIEKLQNIKKFCLDKMFV